MNQVTIDIKWFDCCKRATFHSVLIGTNKLFPETKGRIACGYCGKNGPFEFTNKYYYYQIPIGNKTLYARSVENLNTIRNYFERGLSSTENPESDFPKEFYRRKEEIIKKINAIIEKENGTR